MHIPRIAAESLHRCHVSKDERRGDSPQISPRNNQRDGPAVRRDLWIGEPDDLAGMFQPEAPGGSRGGCDNEEKERGFEPHDVSLAEIVADGRLRTFGGLVTCT